MKVLTAAEMRAVHRRTEEIGITGEILMENASSRGRIPRQRYSPISSNNPDPVRKR